MICCYSGLVLVLVSILLHVFLWCCTAAAVLKGNSRSIHPSTHPFIHSFSYLNVCIYVVIWFINLYICFGWTFPLQEHIQKVLYLGTYSYWQFHFGRSDKSDTFFYWWCVLPVTKNVSWKKLVPVWLLREQRYVPCSSTCTWFKTTDASSFTTKGLKSPSDICRDKEGKWNSSYDQKYEIRHHVAMIAKFFFILPPPLPHYPPCVIELLTSTGAFASNFHCISYKTAILVEYNYN